jgi:hypothetical protein
VPAAEPACLLAKGADVLSVVRHSVPVGEVGVHAAFHEFLLPYLEPRNNRGCEVARDVAAEALVRDVPRMPTSQRTWVVGGRTMV